MGEVLSRAAMSARDVGGLAGLAARLGDGPFALVILFISPQADMAAIAQDVGRVFGAVPVIGCTTAGEISDQGYTEGEVVAVGLPATYFAAHVVQIPDLGALDPQELIRDVLQARSDLVRRAPLWPSEFAYLLVDGLSIREDELTSALATGLGPVPLFGGSAGDGTRFEATFVLSDGEMRANAAVLAIVRSLCPLKVFSLDHLVPTSRRMVVTEADPARRLVRQINAEPAALEYARILGKDPAQLTSFTFAAHPVVVQIGGKHHVRAIQRAYANGDLLFFSAIDEGLVLTLADPLDIETHLAGELAALGAPEAILACDCILRRVEAQDKQKVGAISALLRHHRVVGFSTYGEQVNGMHVNQTMTGVALYRPKEEA